MLKRFETFIRGNMNLLANTYVVFVVGLIFGAFSIHLYNTGLYTENRKSIDPPPVQWNIPKNFSHHHSRGHTGEAVIANELAKKVRVFCFIITMPSSHESKAIHVKATWASRCNGFIFISSIDNKTLPSLKAVDKEGRDQLWNKTAFAINYVHENLLNDYDYFMKADDDTYVIVENLRKLLQSQKPNVPFIMGRRFKPFVKQGYLSGGGGYVMSREAIKLIADGLKNNIHCSSSEYEFAEDVKLGHCAQAVGVNLVDSLDEENRERFHPFNLEGMLSSKNNYPQWFLGYNYHKIESGLDCCSDYAVSFHYVSPNQMYLFEYMLYHLHPYGIHRDYMDLLKYLKVKHLN